ncbi:MAG: GIY-YIG nuclease family protein [Gammaproteobacteria bacterium]
MYLIRTRYGALYTGVATNVARRIGEHEKSRKRGARYLRSKAPLQLAYQAKLGGRSIDLKAESRIKKLSKEKKERIVATNPGRKALLKILGLDS